MRGRRENEREAIERETTQGQHARDSRAFVFRIMRDGEKGVCEGGCNHPGSGSKDITGNSDIIIL